jgi:hypothetical protein
MRKTAVCLFAALLLSAAAPAQTDSKAAGHWEGKIQIPQRELAFAVDLDRNAEGAWVGSISVTGTTAADVPLATVSVDGTTVKFAANLGENASFEGTVSDDGKTISGMATNGQGSAPFQLTRTGPASVKLPAPSSAMTKEFEGVWEGAIEVNGNTVRVGLKLSAGADGKASATMIAISQGNQEFPADTVTIQGKELQVQVRAIGGSYKGTLGAGGEIAGEWSQGPASRPLTFKRVAK